MVHNPAVLPAKLLNGPGRNLLDLSLPDLP